MWLRALNILFELRARVSQNLKTTLDINSHLGIQGTITNTIGPSIDARSSQHDTLQKRQQLKQVKSKFSSKMKRNIQQFESSKSKKNKDNEMMTDDEANNEQGSRLEWPNSDIDEQ